MYNISVGTYDCINLNWMGTLYMNYVCVCMRVYICINMLNSHTQIFKLASLVLNTCQD